MNTPRKPIGNRQLTPAAGIQNTPAKKSAQKKGLKTPTKELNNIMATPKRLTKHMSMMLKTPTRLPQTLKMKSARQQGKVRDKVCAMKNYKADSKETPKLRTESQQEHVHVDTPRPTHSYAKFAQTFRQRKSVSEMDWKEAQRLNKNSERIMAIDSDMAEVEAQYLSKCAKMLLAAFVTAAWRNRRKEVKMQKEELHEEQMLVKKAETQLFLYTKLYKTEGLCQEQLTEEMRQCKQQLLNAEETISVNVKDIEVLEQRQDGLIKELETETKQINELQENCTKNKKLLKDLKEQNLNMDNENQRLQLELNKLEAKKAKLTPEVATMQKTEQAVEQKFSEELSLQMRQSLELEQKFDMLKKQIEHLSQQRKAKALERTAMQNELKLQKMALLKEIECLEEKRLLSTMKKMWQDTAVKRKKTAQLVGCLAYYVLPSLAPPMSIWQQMPAISFGKI